MTSKPDHVMLSHCLDTETLLNPCKIGKLAHAWDGGIN